METNGEAWVGQRLTMVVELLAPGYFAGTAAFDLPSPKGILLVPPAGSPIVSSDTIADVSYTIQRHEVAVFAQRAGAQEIPAFPVRFQFKRNPLDKDAIPATLQTTAIQFTVKLPPGTEKLGTVLSARDLKAVEEWKPEPGRAKAGDAFTRTITYSAPDVPGMAFPPFRPSTVDGLGIYPQPPVVHDRSERGVLQGERRDRVTYVCQRAGKFVLPALRLTWWDLEAKKLQVIDFPQRVFDVAANPAQAAVGTGAPARTKSKIGLKEALPWVGGAALVAGLFALAWRWGWWRAIRGALSHFRPCHLAPLNPGRLAHPPPKPK